MTLSAAQRRNVRAIIDRSINSAPAYDGHRNKNQWRGVREHLVARAELARHYGVTVDDIDAAYSHGRVVVQRTPEGRSRRSRRVKTS